MAVDSFKGGKLKRYISFLLKVSIYPNFQG